MPSLGYFIIATPIPVLILVVSWLVSKKAQAIRRAHEKACLASGFLTERGPQWTLTVLVIVLLAISLL